MQSKVSKIWESKQAQQLAEVLLYIDSPMTMQNFLSDVMTEKEIIEISARLQAARMLTAKERYSTITNETKLSSRTVARISNWLKNGYGGYEAALETLDSHQSHTSPVRAR